MIDMTCAGQEKVAATPSTQVTLRIFTILISSLSILSALQASLDRAKKPAAHAGTASGEEEARPAEAVAEAPAAKPKRQRRKAG